MAALLHRLNMTGMRNLIILLFCIGSFCSCSREYKSLKGGYEYKILPAAGGGRSLSYGAYFAYHMSQRYVNTGVDTLLGDTRDFFMPRTEPLDSNSIQPAWLPIFAGVKKGDSIVIRIPTDSAYRKFVSRMPAHLKSGGYIYTTFKVTDIFANRQQADQANLTEFKKYSRRIYEKSLQSFEAAIKKNADNIHDDAAVISSFLDKNKIPYKRGRWGSFIVMQQEGTGPLVTPYDVVAVNYTGKIFETGKVFDSNIDPQYGHMESLEVTMSQLGSVIPGFTDALLEMKKGSKATVYMPSSLAFRNIGKKSKVKRQQIVVFDLEVTAFISEFEAMEIVNDNHRKEDSSKRLF